MSGEEDEKFEKFKKLNAAIYKSNVDQVKTLLTEIDPNELCYPNAICKSTLRFSIKMSVYSSMEDIPIDVLLTAVRDGTDEIWSLIKPIITSEGIMTRLHISTMNGYFTSKLSEVSNNRQRLTQRFIQILEIDGIDLNEKLDDDSTILSEVVYLSNTFESGVIDIIKRLYEKGIDINIKVKHGFTSEVYFAKYVAFDARAFSRPVDIIRLMKFFKDKESIYSSNSDELSDDLNERVAVRRAGRGVAMQILALICIGGFLDANQIKRCIGTPAFYEDNILDYILLESTRTLSSPKARASLKEVLELMDSTDDIESSKKFILYFCYTNLGNFVINELQKIQKHSCNDEIKDFCVKCIRYMYLGSISKMIFEDLYFNTVKEERNNCDSKEVSRKTFFDFLCNARVLEYVDKHLDGEYVIKNYTTLIKYIDALEIGINSQVDDADVIGFQTQAVQI